MLLISKKIFLNLSFFEPYWKKFLFEKVKMYFIINYGFIYILFKKEKLFFIKIKKLVYN